MAAALALAVSAPMAAAPPDSAIAQRETALVVSPAPIAATESLHVYLLTQLQVPQAWGRDSVKIYRYVQHALVTVVTALMAEQISVERWSAVVRASNPSASSSPSGDDPMRPPAPWYSRSTAHYGTEPIVRATRVTLRR